MMYVFCCWCSCCLSLCSRLCSCAWCSCSCSCWCYFCQVILMFMFISCYFSCYVDVDVDAHLHVRVDVRSLCWYAVDVDARVVMLSCWCCMFDIARFSPPVMPLKLTFDTIIFTWPILESWDGHAFKSYVCLECHVDKAAHVLKSAQNAQHVRKYTYEWETRTRCNLWYLSMCFSGSSRRPCPCLDCCSHIHQFQNSDNFTSIYLCRTGINTITSSFPDYMKWSFIF